MVAEMNRLGMIIDVSHMSDEAFSQTLELSKRPLIASHSACKAIADVPRNLSHDMIGALGRKGGLLGINCFPCSQSLDLRAPCRSAPPNSREKP